MTTPDLGSDLSVDDLAAYSGGALPADAPETRRLLDAALGFARNYCGWHVSPIRADVTVTVDGSGSRMLSLPTCNLISVSAVVEDGADVDPATVVACPDGRIYKTTNLRWTRKPQGVKVTMTHGFADEKPFQAAVLAIADRMSLEAGGRLVRKRIDDVEYQWAGQDSSPTAFEQALLADYLIWVHP